MEAKLHEDLYNAILEKYAKVMGKIFREASEWLPELEGPAPNNDTWMAYGEFSCLIGVIHELDDMLQRELELLEIEETNHDGGPTRGDTG
jgi:hypothetical protein